MLEAAWDGYRNARKSPITRKAGNSFADPDYDLSVDWLQARAAIRKAQKIHDQSGKARILLICGAARNDKTCPGEMSKTYRMAKLAQAIFDKHRAEVDVLDLSLLTSEYGKVIYPCKGCVSTAMPLCHWPCSCYPNHSLGQVSDWMNEIYPCWVAAHGIMIITPVYWQSGSLNDAWQKGRGGEGHRNEGLGLSSAPRGPILCGCCPGRFRGGGNSTALVVGLAG